MCLKEDIQQTEVLQSILIGYHLGNWNIFSVKELYLNTDGNIYLDSLNTVSHQMIHISLKAFSSNPDLFALGSYKIYKTYCFLHLSELGVEWREGRKAAKCHSLGRTVWVSNNFLYQSSHPTLTATTPHVRRHQQLGRWQVKNYCTYPAFQKHSLATYVPIIHHLWPVLLCSMAHLWGKLFSFSVGQKAAEGC